MKDTFRTALAAALALAVPALLAVSALSVTRCSSGPKAPAGSWTAEECALIDGADSVMRVLTVADSSDLAVLRTKCSDFTNDDLKSEEFARLSALLLSTVTDPSQDGVGIAAPQVGLSRRVVAVQRLDKEGEPFEVYPNIRISGARGNMEPGPEGCLSIPGKRGTVLRLRDIDISYSRPDLPDTTERIQGFTAVIFQHECDHLDGVLYTDKATEIHETTGD